MRRMNFWPGLLALVLGLGPVEVLAQAQWPAFELERLELNPGAEGSLVVGMGELLPVGKWRASVAGHYAHQPLMFFRDGEALPVVRGRTTAHLVGAYALTDWLQLNAQLPVVALQQVGDLSAENLVSPATSGLGTPVLAVRVGVLQQQAPEGFDVALEVGTGLPVGSAASLARDEGVRYAPRLMVGKRFGPVRAAVDAGVLLRPGASLNPLRPDAAQALDSELRLGAALVSTGRRLRWELNVRSIVSLAGQPATAELLPGLRYLVNPSFELFALTGLGLGRVPGTPTYRVLIGGSFGHVVPRRGPGESSATCDPGLPHEPEDCPEMDEDGDGVPNALDKCPDKAGSLSDEGCDPRDSDNDSVKDSLDACPTEPGLPSLQGCPILDQDKDGIPDELDSCPTEVGVQENRGCPIRDLDKDGIDNDQDACPNEPGPAERQGCPEEDKDKDGVPNRADACINEPGTADNEGCPAHELPLVAIRNKLLEPRGKVYFEAAQVRVQSRSFSLLDWVAKVLREHPEIPRVVVGAHTDDRGFVEDNRRLSQQRAEAVRRYLIEKGVPPERVGAQGFGPDRPIDSNATSIGRENNRRVEFLIVRDQDVNTQEPQQ